MKVLRHMGFTGSANPCVSRKVGRHHLPQLFARLGFVCGAEIGVWKGVYAEALCRANPALRLTCVDPWQHYADYTEADKTQAHLDAAYEEALRRLGPLGCTVMRMTSEDAAALVPDGSLDFVYIDSNHAYGYVLQDLTLWTPKVRSGGIVAGHDYLIAPPTKKQKHLEVRAAVDRFTAARGIAPVYVTARDKTPSFFWVQA